MTSRGKKGTAISSGNRKGQGKSLSVFSALSRESPFRIRHGTATHSRFEPCRKNIGKEKGSLREASVEGKASARKAARRGKGGKTVCGRK